MESPLERKLVWTEKQLEQVRTENAALKEQMLKQSVEDSDEFNLHHEAMLVKMDQQAAVIEQMQKTIQITAEQIRKCDYTPARSTLLCAMKDFK